MTPAEVVSELRAVYDAFEVEVTERAEGHGFSYGVPGVGLRGAEGELATALSEMMWARFPVIRDSTDT